MTYVRSYKLSSLLKLLAALDFGCSDTFCRLEVYLQLVVTLLVIKAAATNSLNFVDDPSYARMLYYDEGCRLQLGASGSNER